MAAERSVVGNDAEQQLQRACEELRQRLHAGRDCRAEELLDSYPSLSSSEHAYELVVTELSVRRQLGHSLEPLSWYERFPALRNQLQSWFQDQGLLSDSVLPDPRTVEHTPLTAGQAPTVAQPTAPGFGRYQLLEELGRGGMGVVYKARDNVLGRVVALKMIGSGSRAHAEGVDRFYREARAVAQLSHPHIIPLYEIGEHEGQHYFTMAFALGGSLALHRDRVGADPHATAALIEKIARAAHFAHARGILHRDLKPGNIMVDERGEPLVSDFGLAKFLDADAELTQEGVVVGTPAYMPPELTSGNPGAASPRSDVWSLGVILYELLTGKRPFSGTGAKEVSMKVLLSEPARPRTLRPKLDRGLETIVLKCLQKEPARRYQTAEELADDLGRWQRGEAIKARPESWARKGLRALGRHGTWVKVAALVAATAFVAARVWTPTKEPGFTPPSQDKIRPFAMRSNAEPWKVHGMGEATTLAGRVVRFEAKQREFALVELGDTPPWESYRFRVEVQEAGRAGMVGIYVTCQKQLTPLGPEFWLYETSFAERNEFFPPRPESERVGQAILGATAVGLGASPQGAGILDATGAFIARETWQWAKRSLNARRLRWGMPYHFGAFQLDDHFFAAKRGAWRTLSIEVTPNKICAFWDGEALPFASVTHPAHMDHHANRLALETPQPPAKAPAKFGARGGIGLFADGGKGLFRNAVLEPLPAGD